MRRRKRKIRRIKRMCTLLLFFLCIIASVIAFFKYVLKDEHLVADYEIKNYNQSLYCGELFSDDLCVASQDISLPDAPDSSRIISAGLFNLNTNETCYAYKVHDKLYPASLTKLMTALVALKTSDLSEMVTVSANADSKAFAYDEQTCGISEGDKLTLKDLLSGLLIYSGNDNAVAIAEHISGTTEEFADLMNEEAKKIMATESHFVNPNGLHNEDHYTTTYDMYLIFNECLKYDVFREIISTKSYKPDITAADGTKRELEWEQTNYYALGEAKLPSTGTIIGGKTGTTLKAGNCLILLDESDKGTPFISVIMGGFSKETLYQDMTKIIENIPDLE